MSALRALASSPASRLRPHRPASHWAPAALTARPTWASTTSGSSLATISHTAGAQHVLRRPAIIPAASAGGSDAQQYTTREGVTVTVRHAGLQYDLPHYKEHYGPQLEPHVWSLANILRPEELKDIMEALHTKPFLVEKLKKARDTGKITDCSLFHIPHADDIITRLQQMPMFKGLDVEDHRARFQGKGGNRNVHQDPWFYVFRAVVRISADGLSASRLDFHAGQRKSSGSMKSGERIAVLEIPHGEGYITSAQVTCKDTDPGSDIYNNIFHHNVPDDFDGVSLMFNIKARE